MNAIPFEPQALEVVFKINESSKFKPTKYWVMEKLK
jgi:hypothetical protein